MENTRQYRLKVPGMHCSGCIRTVEAALKRVPGTVRVRVDYLRKEATVEGEASLETWLAELQAVGYPAQVIPERAR
ncbi:heavy-metal-associated domain-containing protein [Meiothermus sp.]|jgi:copper chaperone CopZ|uniref:heavy-metal-associated domain-containing protein n=1 Tax=Meiothermus sp. TaxID=1955249 RepID=UPI0021DCB42C|nr:heavy metal-associated domain-containing protein [Meiothermus sp.]GIW24283.1 MAG: heavy metal-binding protein [Meiothermus sp.]